MDQYTSDSELSMVDRQIAEVLEEQLSANLEIVAPSPVKVTIYDVALPQGHIGHQHVDAGGNLLPHFELRTAVISTFVPMSVFNSMLLSRQRAMREARKQKIEILKQSDGSPDMREMLQEEAKETEQTIMSKWLLEQVLTVWKRTEPDMTLDRLENGLTFKQVMGLFNRFFEDLIQSKLNRDRARLSN